MILAYSCDGFTGEILDRLPISDASGERLLSAGGSGTVTVPFDGTWSKAALRDMIDPWRRIIVIERDGKVEYGGYVIARSATLGGAEVKVTLQDAWALFARRGGWDRAHPYTAAWSTTVTGVLGEQAWQAIHRARNTGGLLDRTRFPVTRVSVGGGDVVTRKILGYHFEMVADLLTGLMDEGLDIYLQPRWVGDRFDWGFRAGPAWSSGVTREFAASVADPMITDLAEADDAARLTTNAARLGEGSEVDILARSRVAADTPYPILDRITAVKRVSDPLQLDQQALGDLALYGAPTLQWDFRVLASEGIDVGDTVRIHVSGDPWIADGWSTRRVVKISTDLTEFVKVGVQPVGGA
ncbi:hypothetical protein [Leucobacter tenebrionis]|uniref:hypothetical protein n=1 Tax=Leucobacter tenebrionis TaxID=2873270 RepID=UPI001CA7225C|nr:hypothetical protein [Leucobacter tenebrionis]QZY52927.1 hypothetical protein KVY00_05695 [Leucobacter tenebrionis]